MAIALAGCHSEPSFTRAEDAQDAGREFIRASLDGNYEKARFYLLGDSTNRLLLQKWKSTYDSLSSEEKLKYRDAEIRPIDIHTLNDSVTSYKYYNTFKKDTTTIKIVKVNGEWVADLKELMYNIR